MATNTTIYPAKLLLFGEYALLQGATALAVPMPGFCGQWVWGGDNTRYQKRLLEFAESPALKNLKVIDCQQFMSDVNAGLRFESSIPTGYGLGSSGALCAAVYDRYVQEKTADLSALKVIFAAMESFFHGSSSGIDPLTSYVRRALVVRDKSTISLAPDLSWADAAPGVFLLDSRLPRRTGPLVEWFLAKIAEPEFSAMFQQRYLPAHEAMVGAWLAGDVQRFWSELRLVSALQLAFFSPMIPDSLRATWTEHLEKNDLVFKICGAGGGGFFLVFSQAYALPFSGAIPVWEDLQR